MSDVIGPARAPLMRPLIRPVTRRPLLRRVGAALAGVAVAALWSGTVHADPAGPTDYGSEILSIVPATPEVTLDVLGGDSFVELAAQPGTEVEVTGYFGERYLSFRGDGTVLENRNSPTTYQNEERYGSSTPDFASADAEPDWVQVAGDGTYAWHDHRAHWMQSIRPAGASPGDRIVEAVIPIIVNGNDVDVTVISTWLPEPSVVPLVAGALIGVIAVGGALAFRARDAAWVAVLAPIAVAASAAGWLQYRSLPAETGPRLVWLVPPLLAVTFSVGALVMLRRDRLIAVAAALLGAAQLVLWSWAKRDGLTAAIVPTDAPGWFDRSVTVTALIVGVGLAGVALIELFTPGREPNQARRRPG